MNVSISLNDHSVKDINLNRWVIHSGNVRKSAIDKEIGLASGHIYRIRRAYQSSDCHFYER